MHGRADGRVVIADELADSDGVPHLDSGLVRRADVLYHRKHDLLGRCNRPYRRLAGGLRVIRMNTAIILKGHEHHLSQILHS